MKDRFRVCVLHIHGSSFLDQELNHLHVSFHYCHVQWRIFVSIKRVYIRTVLKTHFCRVEIVCLCCQVKNCVVIRVSVDKELCYILSCLSG